MEMHETAFIMFKYVWLFVCTLFFMVKRDTDRFLK